MLVLTSKPSSVTRRKNDVPGRTIRSMHFQINVTSRAAFGEVPMIFGVALYGVGAVMMVLALSNAELSVLLPAIPLSYVWLHEYMNLFSVAGISVIPSV